MTTDSPDSIARLNGAQKQRLVESFSEIINEQRRSHLQEVLAARTRHITVVLEDIYQAQNASAVIRSAECLGIQEIHIIENRNEYQLNPAVVQGAAKWLEIKRYREPGSDNTRLCLQTLRERGYRVVAMTLREGGREFAELPVMEKTALCFGSEEPGLSELAHGLADDSVTIPMCGFTQSFNLSVSAGIALYNLCSRLRSSAVKWQLDEEDRLNLYIDWLHKSTPSGKVLLQRFLRELEDPQDR